MSSNQLVVPARVPIKGEILAVVRDIYTGKRQLLRYPNLVTNVQKNRLAQFVIGTSINPPSHIALGTGALAINDSTTQDTNVDLTSSGANQQLAQEFQIGSTSRGVHAVLLWLKRTGTSPGTLVVELQLDSSGLPSGTVLVNGTSTAVAINSLSTDYGWIEFLFPSTPTLDASTAYQLVLKSSGYTYSDGVTEVIVGADTSAPGYANGDMETYNGSAWSAYSPAADMCFRVTAEPTLAFTALTAESTRQALTSTKVRGNNVAYLLTSFTAAQAVGQHGEVGLFDAAANGNMWAVAAINVNKTNSQTLNTYWLVTYG